MNLCIQISFLFIFVLLFCILCPCSSSEDLDDDDLDLDDLVPSDPYLELEEYDKGQLYCQGESSSNH